MEEEERNSPEEGQKGRGPSYEQAVMELARMVRSATEDRRVAGAAKLVARLWERKDVDVVLDALARAKEMAAGD